MLQGFSSPEDYQNMTFQIGMVCADGIVIASDSLTRYYTPGTSHDSPGATQETRGSKFVFSPSRKIVCCYAGSPSSEPIASAIAHASENINFASPVDWSMGLRVAANVQRSTSQTIMDEVIVCRIDTEDQFWIVARPPDTATSVISRRDAFCIGINSNARFLVKRLYHKDLSIQQAKNLCLLTLAFASQDDSSNIGEPFEIVVLRKGNIECKSYSASHISAMQIEFATQIKKAFENIQH